MRNFLVMIGWKHLNGKWDRKEIKIDIIIFLVVGVFASTVACYG